MNREDRDLFIYFFGLGFVILITHMFWLMFLNNDPNILIQANNYGEFWIEFILLNVMLCVFVYACIKKTIEYWKK